MTESPDLIALIESLSDAKVLCVGDIMFDHFIYGTAERLSPEAPVPILKIGDEDTMLGGAGNVVQNLVALGAELQFVSVVGDDEVGKEVKRLFGDLRISNPTLIVDDSRRTSVKIRYIAETQQVLRADQETVAPLRCEIRKRVLKASHDALKECSVLVLSDYGKGVLLDGMARTLIDQASNAGVPVIVDPKSADYADYAGASIITPNRQELHEASRKPVDTEEDIVKAANDLISKHKLGAILATRSSDGMTIITSAGKPIHLPTEARDVFDVSGAGDTVVASIAASLAISGTFNEEAGSAKTINILNLKNAAQIANTAASIVVGKVGTATASADEIIAALNRQSLSEAEAKVLSSDALVKQVEDWRKQKLRIGFTNGCFELLHPGHLSLLHQAKDDCDRLIVGLNADVSVQKLKGKDRPVQSEAARATVLASLASVDAITIFSEDTPLALIKAIRPDVLIKGEDYELKDVVGAKEVEGYGGTVLLAKLSPGHSTTATIEKLNKNSA